MSKSELLRVYFENPNDLLLAEVQGIKSPEIRRFTLEVLNAADPQFWIAACSSSGKYHPPEDQGDGGLVRHIIKAVAVAQQDCRRFTLFDEGEKEKDIVLSAVFLHDTCKNGIPWGENTDYSHGLRAAEWLEQFPLNLEEDSTAKQQIIAAVRYHMGRWLVLPGANKEENDMEIKRATEEATLIEQVVQNADFFSSRQSMSFLPGVSIVDL